MNRLRVVNLALPKTGTTTLAKALRRAGMNVADWRIRGGQSSRKELEDQHIGKIIYEDFFSNGDPLTRLDEFDAINEMSVVGDGLSLWPQTHWALLSAIEKHHPGVKFILTTRDPAKTANSMMRWNNLGRHRLPKSNIPGLPRGIGGTEPELAQWLDGHYQFCRQVFRGASNFLEYDIDDDDAREKISAYLGVDMPWWGKSNVGTPEIQKDQKEAV